MSEKMERGFNGLYGSTTDFLYTFLSVFNPFDPYHLRSILL